MAIKIPPIIRYYLLLMLGRRKNGHLPNLFQRNRMKRLIAFHLLRLENERLRHLVTLASTKRSRRFHVHPMLRVREIFGAWHSLLPLLRESDTEEFYNFLRMTPDCFDWLLEKVAPLLRKRSRRQSISAGERLAVTLRYLATSDSHQSLSYIFRISNQAISKIVIETTAAIWFALKPLVFEPITEDFWRQKAAEFEAMWQFPMCVGALDGKHCVFQKFPMRGSEFYNYKGTHSVVLLALWDS